MAYIDYAAGLWLIIGVIAGALLAEFVRRFMD